MIIAVCAYLYLCVVLSQDFDVTMPEPTEDEERQIKEEKRLKKKRKAEKRERNLLAAKKAELKKQLLQEQNGEK